MVYAYQELSLFFNFAFRNMLVSRNVDKRLLGSLSNDDDDAEDDT